MKYLYILILSLLFIACGNSEKNGKPVAEAEHNSDEIIISKIQFEGENMQLGKLEKHTFNQTIMTSGMIDVPPHNKATISTFMGGYITKTPLLIGDKVKKGQLLVTLQNPEFVEIQQHYLEISEQLSYLKSEFERQQTLYNEKITSQKNFLKAESNYKSNLAQLNGLRKKLQMLHISPEGVEHGKISSTISLYSPIDGFVTKVNISNGAYVSPSDIVMEIVDTEHIHLELAVFEKDILNVKKGQKIRFKIPEASDETFDADVHLVGTTIDENSRIVKVHGHITNEKQANFIVGMFVEAKILTNATSHLSLPNDAILEIENGYYALILNKKVDDNFYFKKVKLNIGEQTEAFTVIENPETLENKAILTQGGFMLLNEGGSGHSH
ncbi:efflux RND transporter periplasmic adaptor subunit [Flavisericum labens]|uniref:efflux RND transporter periplasmic adaptor subunit n=1 Tax=Flavisericum labens TaxID=3377112 RepID=UPI00387B0666